MIQVRDNRGNYHETLAIYDNAGREIKEVRNNQGRLLFKNWNDIQGSPPITFRGYGKNLTDYRIYGNTSQNGTPTPENPSPVVGCGERTENLFSSILENGLIDANTGQNKQSQSDVRTADYIEVSANKIYSFSRSDTIDYIKLRFYSADKSYIGIGSTSTIRLIEGNTEGNPMIKDNSFCCFEIINPNIKYMRINSTNGNLSNKYMMVEGEYTKKSMPEYEPYGYKIPVTVSDGTNSITTPVYIGNEPLHKIDDYADYVDYARKVVVRRIKKIVLTDNRYCKKRPSTMNTFQFSEGMVVDAICTHYSIIAANKIDKETGIYAQYSNAIIFTDLRFTEINDFKSFLSAQYSAGTPVTVWCVLAEPEEEPLENLLPIQTIKGTNILTADTTVQPSKMYIKGKIKSIT